MWKQFKLARTGWNRTIVFDKIHKTGEILAKLIKIYRRKKAQIP